jgi:hypothetical protein
MAEDVRLARADLKKQADLKKPAAKARVTMRGLWRLVMWGTTAAAAMLLAVLSSRGMVGSQRAAIAVSTLSGGTVAAVQPAASAARSTFDTQAETRRLGEAVRELASENDQLKARIGMVEHGMDDMTGSIARQVQQAKATAAQAAPWPDAAIPVPATTAAIATVIAPALPLPMEYGADIGSAVSMPALRARWAGIRSAHPQLFAGLTPTVSLSQMSPTNRPELRLVIGPLPSADAAAKLCASLEKFRLVCQPTIFAGQHPALD